MEMVLIIIGLVLFFGLIAAWATLPSSVEATEGIVESMPLPSGQHV